VLGRFHPNAAGGLQPTGPLVARQPEPPRRTGGIYEDFEGASHPTVPADDTSAASGGELLRDAFRTTMPTTAPAARGPCT